MKNIESILPFIKEIDRLKKIERQALIHSGGRHENTAEHSWHLAMCVLVFQSFSDKKIDLHKAIKMALLHDLVEIDAGDTFVYDDLSQKKDKEIAAIERLTSLLPADLAQEFKTIWFEFEDGQSAEAQYVSAIDRFLPMYSNFLNEGYSWKNHKVTSDRVVARTKKPITQGLPALWELTEKMLEKAIQDGHLEK